MDIVDKHFNLILDKYNLNYDYNKWSFASTLSSLLTEFVYIFMILFSILLEKSPKKIINYATIIFITLGSSIIVDRIAIKYLVNFTKKFKIANYNYGNNLLTKLDKKFLLDLDLSNYSITIDGMNKNFTSYIENKKFKSDYIILFMSLIVIGVLNKNNVIIIAAIIYSTILYQLNKKKNIKIEKYTELVMQNEENIHTFILNSKNNIMNNNNNNNYHDDKVNKLYNLLANVYNENDSMIFYANLITFVILTTIIYKKRYQLSPVTFLVYFFLLYDLQHITNKILTYFKNELDYNKLPARVNFINELEKNTLEYIHESVEIDTIKINRINNNNPKLILNKPLIINKDDKILIDGISGSGKSSLLHILANIIQIDTIDIEPSIDIISNRCYITLADYKGLMNGKLYDIISNYNDVDINIMNKSISASKFNIELLIEENPYINLNEISTGEKMRLLIAKTIYTIMINDKYKILLFDEIDSGLDDSLARDICLILLDIFKNKTILYITHNNNVKKLFMKKILLTNGTINH
jgi:ABC-type lipoprotein export system ATPase subunit